MNATVPPETRAIMQGGEQVASVTVHRRAPSWGGRRTAALGPFTCTSPDAGGRLVREELVRLQAEGFEAVVGPMDGDTWRSYRYVLEGDGSPPFVMEPPDRPAESAALLSAGFAVIATYASARAPLAPSGEPVRLNGVKVTAWDGYDDGRLMDDVFALSSEAFARNPFYLPLDRAGFDALYGPLVPRLDPRLMLFARGAGDELLGFVFGMPDLLNPASRTVVLKTYASRRRGVGHALADAFHRVAYAAGFTEVIHALMHEGNASLDRSGRHHGKVFRRYALYGRALAR